MADESCGCAASVVNNSECDCTLQSACFCDGTCTCKLEVCVAAEH